MTAKIAHVPDLDHQIVDGKRNNRWRIPNGRSKVI